MREVEALADTSASCRRATPRLPCARASPRVQMYLIDIAQKTVGILMQTHLSAKFMIDLVNFVKTLSVL